MTSRSSIIILADRGKPYSHVDSVVNKANGTLGFLRKNLQISSPSLKTTAYTSVVRPVLEYASTVWDPYTKSCIDKMEMVQRRAARYVLHRYHNTSSVGKMLDTLQWTSLEERRKQQCLAMLYKIQHGQMVLNISDYLKPAPRISRHSRVGISSSKHIS